MADAPSIKEIDPMIYNALATRDLIIYNADFDTRMLEQSYAASGVDDYDKLWLASSQIACAMQGYAEYFGEWNDYHGNYRWQQLSAAIRQQGLKVDAAHSALGDCLMVLALVKHLATVKREPAE